MKLANGREISDVYLFNDGRLNNREYLLHSATICIVYLIFIKLLECTENFIPEYILGLLTMFLAIFVLISRINLGIKRCHDLGHRGTWLLWYLCPIFNIIFPFILYFKKGDNHENEYGKVTKNLNKKTKIITTIAVIIRRGCVRYLWYNIIIDFQIKLAETTQQVNQELQYESSTQKELSSYFGDGNTEYLKDYRIPKIMLENDPDLIDLIIGSPSLGKIEEKQQWFDLYTIANDEQKENLRDILTSEKERIAEIEEKYQNIADNIIELQTENIDTISE